MRLTRELLQTINNIAIEAAAKILAVYRRPGVIEVNSKADQSPVTEADLQAHRVIVDALAKLTPDIPVLSEESADVSFAIRQQWQRYWLVDPLDGTKEFISRNGEFTVNIALISGGKPVLGVVHVPVTGVSYLGLCEQQHLAWRAAAGKEWQPIRVSIIAAPASSANAVLRVVASRRHGEEAMERFLSVLKASYADIELLNMGSSLKICLIAEGHADVYPRLAPTSEWDTAAAHAVLLAAGGDILQADLVRLAYNTKDSLLNPAFFAVAAAGQQSLSVMGDAMCDAHGTRPADDRQPGTDNR
jgi:3'(2'), 5'-bisphosphate nucleotidase